MEWWQSLLIALVPAILSTAVAIVVPLTQILSAKKERVARYESDRRQHISQMRLDMEFSIYKELSEKVVRLVGHCLCLYDGVFEVKEEKITKRGDYTKLKKRYEDAIILYNEANRAINKHAIFIQSKWYEKFKMIKRLCKEHMISYNKYIVLGDCVDTSYEEIVKESDIRGDQIAEVFNSLVKDLREHITNLG